VNSWDEEDTPAAAVASGPAPTAISVSSSAYIFALGAVMWSPEGARMVFSSIQGVP